ncbi:hypothetical protein N657DRAFT_48232 [Parathielavia appendiculata]|uniref:Uncharacterized protein n=1 Tax=Parathielavia appendiculata TaxID=2587402 RepID=A0AAN6Z8H6_9PEZI|nr:hypothetical protein N657DRAFT_48232 [Parathielavia appendiculata]
MEHETVKIHQGRLPPRNVRGVHFGPIPPAHRSLSADSMFSVATCGRDAWLDWWLEEVGEMGFDGVLISAPLRQLRIGGRLDPAVVVYGLKSRRCCSLINLISEGRVVSRSRENHWLGVCFNDWKPPLGCTLLRLSDPRCRFGGLETVPISRAVSFERHVLISLRVPACASNLINQERYPFGCNEPPNSSTAH